MTNQLWSWVMGGLGLAGLWLAGSARTRAGSWLFGAALQLAWVAYAALTAQYGLVLPCVVAVAINARNFRTERRERAATRPATGATLVEPSGTDPRTNESYVTRRLP